MALLYLGDARIREPVLAQIVDVLLQPPEHDRKVKVPKSGRDLLIEPLDLSGRGEPLDGDTREVVAADELLTSPSLDESRIALSGNLHAMQARTDRIAERTAHPGGCAAVAR